jgi:hypothetical protein
MNCDGHIERKAIKVDDTFYPLQGFVKLSCLFSIALQIKKVDFV